MREKFDKIIKMAIRKIANLVALFYGKSQKNASEYFGRGPQFNEVYQLSEQGLSWQQLISMDPRELF